MISKAKLVEIQISENVWNSNNSICNRLLVEYLFHRDATIQRSPIKRVFLPAEFPVNLSHMSRIWTLSKRHGNPRWHVQINIRFSAAERAVRTHHDFECECFYLRMIYGLFGFFFWLSGCSVKHIVSDRDDGVPEEIEGAGRRWQTTLAHAMIHHRRHRPFVMCQQSKGRCPESST